MFLASKAKTIRVLPKTEDNSIELETKAKETKTCSSPQYEIMKVLNNTLNNKIHTHLRYYALKYEVSDVLEGMIIIYNGNI